MSERKLMLPPLNLKVKKLENFKGFAEHKDGFVGRKDGDAGFDLHYAGDVPVRFFPGDQYLLKSGIAISCSPYYYLRVAPRSGLAYKHKIDVMAGVIDSGYRSEVGVILKYTAVHNDDPFVVYPGDRIAQLIPTLISPSFEEWEFVDNLEESERGEGGFGSTGI